MRRSNLGQELNFHLKQHFNDSTDSSRRNSAICKLRHELLTEELCISLRLIGQLLQLGTQWAEASQVMIKIQ